MKQGEEAVSSLLAWLTVFLMDERINGEGKNIGLVME